ncbi:uncharacterized protein [Clytia hemisphaerica]|uniref:SH2 domain-containing protein n=1 Tax=Clytia hemisphaerica TaxID=252671 RepID=A0A7M5V8G3_9CNID
MPFIRRSGKEHFRFEKSCKFIGSLAISLLKGNERQSYVNEKLLEMKDVGKGIAVIINVTDEGIKILKDDTTAVKMAHGITKVLFSTCHPDQKLFAYVVKAPGANGKMVTQAHMFKTNKSKHTQELSSAISRAFKIAYSRNTLKRENRVDLFEKEAEDNKEIISAQKKRWAKNEMAHGHDNAAHAMRAKGYKSTKGVVASSATQRQIANEKPSSGIQKLVDSLSKEETEDPKGKLPGAKILPARSDQTLDEYSRRAAEPYKKERCLSEEDVFPMRKEPNEERFTQSAELRKVSQESTPLDDWDVVRISMTDLPTASSNFVSPAPKFGSISEETAIVNNSPAFSRPVSKFGTLPESGDEMEDEEEGDETADFIYQNVNQNNQVEYQFNLDQRNETPEKNERTPKAKQNENGTPKSSRSSDQKVKKRSRRKKIRDVPAASRMTMSEEQILKDAEWYQPGFSRSIAEEILQNRPVGSFFVRDSTSHQGSFVMTMRVPKEVKESQSMNYLIVQDRDGLYRIKGFQSIFPGLTHLVAHYSSIEEDIPCRLHISSDNPSFEASGEEIRDQKDAANELDYLFDEEQDQDYVNFSSNFDICRELDELCFS